MSKRSNTGILHRSGWGNYFRTLWTIPEEAAYIINTNLKKFLDVVCRLGWPLTQAT